MVKQRFRYGASLALVLVVVVMFGGAGALFFFLASSGRSVRLFPLGVEVAGTPVYVLSLVSLAFAAAMIAVRLRAHQLGRRELVIATSYVEAPKHAWTAERLRVRKAAVRSSALQNTFGTKVLVIERDDGVKLAISNRTVGEDGLAAVLAWLAAAPAEERASSRS